MPEEEMDRHENGEAAEDQEAIRRLEEEIGKLTVADHIGLMLHSLSSMAVDRLGMGQGGTERLDLAQARMAIDGFGALLGVLEGRADPDEFRAHRAALSQLQMAYVAVTGPAPESEAGPGDDA